MWSDLAQILIGPSSKLAKRLWFRLRLWWFKRRSRKPLLNQETAKEIVYLAYPGVIDSVHCYRNIDSKRIYIAALCTPHQDKWPPRVLILEQAGGTYRTIWNSDEALEDVVREIEVLDLDNDGFTEVAVAGGSGGTGAFSRFICIFSHRYNQHYEISEFVNFQEFAGPVIPEVDIRPLPPESLRKAIEIFAMKRGFLKEPPQIDWDDPQHAIKRWHRDNGANPCGRIQLKFYEGPAPSELDIKKISEEIQAGRIPDIAQQVSKGKAPFASSIADYLDDGKIFWISFFKNPLVGFIKAENRWFIAYSPSNFYSWARSLAYDGKRIWFATHSSKGIFSFHFDKRELLRHLILKGIQTEEPETVEFKKGRLKVGDYLSLTVEELDQICSGSR